MKKKLRKRRRNLVYALTHSHEPAAVFVEEDWAKQIPRVRSAVKNSRTWKEFRCNMPRAEYSRLVREYFDKDREPRPKGSDPFNVGELPTIDDAPYPWPWNKTAKALPKDLLQKYGHVYVFVWYVSAKKLPDLLSDLEARGYKVSQRQDLQIVD